MYRIRFHLKIYKNMKEKSALNQTKMFICYLKQKLFHGFKRRNSKTYDNNVAAMFRWISCCQNKVKL